MGFPRESTLDKVYGESRESKKRFERLADSFRERFQDGEMDFFTSPGRTEIIGNHTDHNGGRILAGSIDLDTIGAARKSGDTVVHIVSEGYNQPIVIDIRRLDKVPKNKGTVSLVAGMLDAVMKFGFKVSGFFAYVSTNVISSAGVSSSASFEMLICSIVNDFFNEGKMSYVDYARIGQYAENVYWEKASGLMDQMACAVGGTILLNFSEREENIYEKVDFSFEDAGYDLVIVNTGKGHADLSREYSEIPLEMREVAEALGQRTLAESSEKELLNNFSKVERAVGNDRAILRALHFFEENERTLKAAEAIRRKDTKELLRLIEASGNSSWKWLQNCYTMKDYREQRITLVLSLTELYLKRLGDGCCRVHGGGFAGVIMAVVPQKNTADYVAYMSQFIDKSLIYPMNIRKFGAGRLE